MHYDPLSKAHLENPFPVYRELRDEHPALWADSLKGYVISRFEDVQSIFKDTERFSSDTRRRMGAASEMTVTQRMRLLFHVVAKMRMNPLTMRDAGGRMLIQEDPPVHGVMRAIVNKGFTPRRIAVWEKRIREIAAERMDAVRDQAQFDFVSEIAIPLPVTVISELLGIPAKDRHLFKKWSDSLIDGATGENAIENPINSGIMQTLGDLRRYMLPIIRRRMANPEDDLISVLTEASDGEASLTEFEIVMFILLLLVAGNETTTNLLGNTVDALLSHRDRLEQVASDPALVPALIEESLRYDSPVQQLRRTTRCDVEVAGTAIPKDSDVFILLGSANRDERRYENPDQLDLARDTKGHLGFGLGNHFCLGASLARLEARCTLDVVIPELVRMERAEPQKEMLRSFTIRGRERLPLRRV